MRFLKYIFCALLFATASVAETININWLNNGETYTQTTCEIGGDIILPTPPTKRGYTLVGWEIESYQKVDYITFTGAPVVDTGISFDTECDVIEADLTFKSAGSGGSYAKPFGAASTESYGYVTGGVLGVILQGANVHFQCGSGSTRLDSISTVSDYHDYVLTLDRTTNTFTAFIDGVDKGSKVSTTKTYSTNTISIGAIHTNSGYSSKANATVKHVSIKKDGVLVRDMQPCVRMSDGAYGFYDSVSHTFFGNVGTGLLTGGPIIEAPFLE